MPRCRQSMWPFEDDEYPEGYLLPDSSEAPTSKPAEYGRRHGAAVLHYRRGEPFAADHVRLPDGTRGRVRLAFRSPHWRRPLNDHARAWTSAALAIPIHWRWGTLVVTPDDLIFEDDQSLWEVSFHSRNERLDGDLCQSKEIRELVLTMEGCNALYGLLLQGLWVRDPEDECSTYSRKDAAKILAKIRCLGETYHDFRNIPWLNYRGYPAEYQLMRHHLKRLGWYDILEQPIDTLFSESRPNEPAGFLELMRRLALFVVASVVAFHILLAIAVLTGG